MQNLKPKRKRPPKRSYRNVAYNAAYPLRNAQSRILVSEMIGRTANFKLWRDENRRIDETIPDYRFWDRLRNCKASGYEFGGMFCSPLAQIIASHVLGDGIQKLELDSSVAEGSDEQIAFTNQLLDRFRQHLSGLLQPLLTDLYGLGDQYAIVNLDGSLSIPNVAAVDMQYDPLDYRRAVKAVITTETKGGLTITDAYTADQRVVEIKKGNVVQESTTYSNILGRLPVVHFPNNRGANETHGHSQFETMLPLLDRYDDVMLKGLDGAELMGTPIPAIVGLEDVNQIKTANSPTEDETYTDIDGNAATRNVINMDSRSGILLGAGADFKLVSPPTGFSEDVRGMLKMLFYLMLDHTRVPEVLWGGAIASSKASADVQMPPFYTFIEGRRLQIEGQNVDTLLGLEATGGLYQLIDLWLQVQSFRFPTRVVVSPTLVTWPDLADIDPEVKRKWSETLYKAGGISTERLNSLSGLMDDPDVAIEEAQAEAAESQEAADSFNADLAAAFKQLSLPLPAGA